jgi:hypothetical protein
VKDLGSKLILPCTIKFWNLIAKFYQFSGFIDN